MFAGLTDTDIVGITVSFLIEAYETSANTLMVGLYQLATYPEIQEKLALEIQDAIDKNNGEITYDIIQKHEYLDKVLDGKNLQKLQRNQVNSPNSKMI